jgi:Sel1 repeat
MTRWCLIVALVVAAPSCQRQMLSDEQWARSVGISPAPAPNPPERLPVVGGAELKDRPDDNPQPVNIASPEEGSVPVSDSARKEAMTSPPAPAPEAPLRNETPEPPIAAAPVARATPSRPDVPAAPPSGPIREAVRNSSPATVLRAPAPSTADPVRVLIERGDAMLALHDIGSARLLYERAAQAGNSRAAAGVGKTFDPNFLRREGAVGLQPNRSEAINWYQKAAALGDPEAAVLLRQLQY